ncbi:valine--tRNA ligase [Peptoniphilus sp. HMSC062D09]|uniref:valine--tRNA ligase n=1 Tax=Peptoniphilus sp. HMSC062D09 TaxID=1739305 RepID=UPI0008A287BB|nr:valine--tRNA ligase [Peptoniphilus sp. HMSC062D09]OFK84099.1 valine--tRNA ligase [Peptoniphilus sp. HMSC062D09]
MKDLNKTYDPKDFEEKIYDYWMENNYFRAEVDENKKPYSIVMPPPNVTGNLHMGHALNNTIQDVLIRTKRMQGYSALWIPGTDHASISTEAKVVEKLRSEGIDKEDIGREKFLERAWDWTHEYGGNIVNQLKKLGISCDWSRQSFTLDENLSNAVEEVFIELYEKGLIYRGNRIINWCPSCETSISDAEVEHIETDSNIWYFKYPFADREGGIEIATTRPETIPGDLAIAVNPNDERYTDLVGEYVMIPVMGNKKIPIIADEYVEMDFGSGAVKITPSHDPNDFEVGSRHNLGQLVIMDGKGYLNENAGDYAGMERYEARKKIIEDFEKLGYYIGKKHHHNAVGHCERCKTVIEPLISKQWFVKMAPLAKPALEEYRKGNLNIVPERFGKIYENWLENIRDWNISRQLWWGHRLPVWYSDSDDEIVISKTDPSNTKGHEGKTYTQDEDTLDTWFSSALWPFSTMGWPEKTPEYEYFYPTNVLVTGYDIIFFWVIRMVFSALEQTGKLPFKDVLLNGLVRDDQGRKMSKSLGNGIDPLDIIRDYGADALRFTLVTGNTPGNDMRFYTKRVEANRNFANKLWNATRFLMMNMSDEITDSNFDVEKLHYEDKWILSKLQKVIKQITEKIEKYDIGLAADDIYDFIWSDFCDWYIEIVKPVLYSDNHEEKTNTVKVLLYVLENILKLLHPFMPYITEEIWQALPNREEALIVSKWPEHKEELVFEKEERATEYIENAIREIRNARSEMNIENSKKSNTLVYTKDPEVKEIFEEMKGLLLSLGYSNSVEITDDEGRKNSENIAIVLDKAEIQLPLKELVDFEKELKRLQKDKKDAEAELKRAKGKLSNQGFVSKAPAKLIEEEKEKVTKYEEILKTVEEQIVKVEKNL